MKKQETIKQLKNTIAELSKNPAEADTVKALKKQLADMQLCAFATEKNCFKCGGKQIFECGNPKVQQETVSPGFCRNCKYFTPCHGIAQGDTGSANE